MDKDNKTMIDNKSSQDSCPYCGAPVTSEICPYCGSKTWLDTANADMEYPEIECKEAHLNFWNLGFPAIFAFAFGIFGFFLPLLTGPAGVVLLVCVPFAIIGLVAAIIVLKNLYYYVTVRSKGRKITGKVYGYVDDNVMLNGTPAQVCKILVHTPEGPRFIMYQMKRVDHPYKVNSRIDLKVFKDRFTIVNSDTTPFHLAQP